MVMDGMWREIMPNVLQTGLYNRYLGQFYLTQPTKEQELPTPAVL
jgi:hypothetical protein